MSAKVSYNALLDNYFIRITAQHPMGGSAASLDELQRKQNYLKIHAGSLDEQQTAPIKRQKTNGSNKQSSIAPAIRMRSAGREKKGRSSYPNCTGNQHQ